MYMPIYCQWMENFIKKNHISFTCTPVYVAYIKEMSINWPTIEILSPSLNENAYCIWFTITIPSTCKKKSLWNKNFFQWIGKIRSIYKSVAIYDLELFLKV